MAYRQRDISSTLRPHHHHQGAVTFGYVAARAASGRRGSDARTLSFLLARSLAEKEQEEEERKAEFARMVAELRQASSACAREFWGSKRKREKRRKKKTPRTSSSCGRAHRRQRQWYVHGSVLTQRPLRLSAGPGCQASWTVWTRMTVFIALVVDSGSGMCRAGFAGILHLALCFFCRCQALMPLRTRQTVMWRNGHLHPYRGAEAIPMAGIPSCRTCGGRCRCCPSRADSQVPLWRRLCAPTVAAR